MPYGVAGATARKRRKLNPVQATLAGEVAGSNAAGYSDLRWHERLACKRSPQSEMCFPQIFSESRKFLARVFEYRTGTFKTATMIAAA